MSRVEETVIYDMYLSFCVCLNPNFDVQMCSTVAHERLSMASAVTLLKGTLYHLPLHSTTLTIGLSSPMLSNFKKNL